MFELAILIGLQGSGKSTFFLRRLAATHVCVSKDHFRNNKNPARRQTQLISEAMAAKRSVAVDNTNVTIELRRELIELGRSFGATIIGYDFGANLEVCLARNANRRGKAKVPDVGMYATMKRWVRPQISEGFDRLFQISIQENGEFEVRDQSIERSRDNGQ